MSSSSTLYSSITSGKKWYVFNANSYSTVTSLTLVSDVLPTENSYSFVSPGNKSLNTSSTFSLFFALKIKPAIFWSTD